MKKLFSLFLALALLVCVVPAMAETYTGQGNGNNGPIKVEVVYADGKIESVTVTEHNETPGICDGAIANIPAEIVAAQGLNVDLATGATNSSKGILEAVTAALTEAGVDVEALKAVSGPEAEQATDAIYTADVIVVGAGGAGCAAGVQANQDGASVIILEKQGAIGGNTILSGGAFNAVRDGSPEAVANNDTMFWHFQQTYEGGDKIGDPELIMTLVKGAYDGYEWLKGMGMEFIEGEVFTVTGGLWPRAHKPVMPVGTGFFDTYQKYVDGHDGIEFHLNTTAQDLVTDLDGNVIGVYAVGETGNAVFYKANKAVVLASGGFGRNIEMRTHYDTLWGCLDETIPSTNAGGITGDGIKMAQALGAELVGMEYIQLLPLGDPETGSLKGNIEMDVNSRIFVNKEGKRFVNEAGRRDEMTKGLFAQTDSWMWIVMDSDRYPTGDEKNNFNESINELVALGKAFKGETLEELAAAIDVPADVFVATIDEFNGYVDSGETDPFGRAAKFNTAKIDNGPFYAAPRVPTVHHTMGGVKINTNAEVIREDGSIIGGLYAAGEITGGIHGTNRLGGNALADILVFGRIAGANAAAK